MSVSTYEPTRRYNREDYHLRDTRREPMTCFSRLVLLYEYTADFQRSLYEGNVKELVNA
jgi:hypothetical protein